MPDIFVRKGFPRLYESILSLPIIRTIRAQERQLLHNIFAENLQPTDQVLEVGAGTGYYTLEIAERVRSVLALERSPGMARILSEKIVRSERGNIRVVEHDFFSYTCAERFDVVIAIGVLDSINEWTAFLDHCIKLASRRVIVTVPQPSAWGHLYRFFSVMTRSPARLYHPRALERYFSGRAFKLYETGLPLLWTRGMTLAVVANIEKT